jgi:hypothetical protein
MNFTSRAETTLSEAHSLASSYSHIESKRLSPTTTTQKKDNPCPLAENIANNFLVTPLHIAFALLSEEDHNSRLKTIFTKTAGDLVQFERSVRRQLVRLPSQVTYLIECMILTSLLGASSRANFLRSCGS